MKKQLLLLIMILLPVMANAYDLAVKNADGVYIYYNYTHNGTELEVTYSSVNYNSYSGSVVIPKTVSYMGRTREVTRIGGLAFWSSKDMTSVTIPSTVTSIGDSAFGYCEGLTSVHISDIAAWCKIDFETTYSNPVYYAHQLFLNGKEIKELVIPSGVTSIGKKAFIFCTLTSVTIPNSVTSIGDDAFNLCALLTKVNIPSSVTSIGEGAFCYCPLIFLTIPNSVISIGKWAFYGSDIPIIIAKIENPFDIRDDVFSENTFYNATLYVPKGTINKYKSTGGWKNFSFIEEYTEGDNPSGVDIKINEENFPDANFRSYLTTKTYGTDGVITNEEIANIKTINVRGLELTNLNGIEFFTALENLYCDVNQITKLDVSKNNALTILSCANNKLKELDLSENTALTELNCCYNELEKLDLSKNIALTNLDCYCNKLVILDMSKNTQLKGLGCRNNQLESIIISECKELKILRCQDNKLESIDVSNNIKLTELTISNNKLRSLNVLNNNSLTDLLCNGNLLTALDISNTELYTLYCYQNFIKDEEMDILISGLSKNVPIRVMKVIYNEGEGNVMTTKQVAEVKAKNWTPYYYDGTEWKEYAGSKPSGIDAIKVDDAGAKIFSLDGKSLDKPQKGVNIVRLSNGETRKVVKK